jgi:fused signal recognition particle receptor
MFDRLKKLFRRAEEDVQKKVEEKVVAAPPAIEPKETLAPEVLEAMREVEAEEVAKKEKPKAVEKPRVVEKPKPVEKPKLAEKPKVVEKPKAPERPKAEEPEERGEVPKPEEAVEEPVAEEVAYSHKKPSRPAEELKEESDKRVEKKIKIGIGARLRTAFGAKARLSEGEINEITWNLQMGLMQSDVAMEVADAITAELKQKLSSEDFRDPRGQVREIFKSTLMDILESGGKLDFMAFVKKHPKPVKIVFFGINGTGKTTTIAKVAHLLKKNGFSVVAAAGDTFRAGAQEQLGKHMERIGVKMVHHQRGGDAAAVVFDAVKHAKAEGIDIVLADTSGRMQSDADLMGEMEKIVRVNGPDLKVFVGDALTGNDAVEQAREFNSRIGIDATILAKCDASKGGAALSVSYITKKPIIFLGMGQTYDDLVPFDAKKFVDEII